MINWLVETLDVCSCVNAAISNVVGVILYRIYGVNLYAFLEERRARVTPVQLVLRGVFYRKREGEGYRRREGGPRRERRKKKRG